MKKLLGLILLLASPAAAQQVPPPNQIGIACAYNTSLPTIVDGNFGLAQCDATGHLLVSGAGGGGGGAATIADGADVAEGTTTDVAWVSGAGTTISLLKSIKAGVPVTGTFWQTTQPISDAILDAAVTSNRVQVNGLIGSTGIVGGAGNVSAGVQRVTIATDQAGYSVNATGVASENHTGEVGQNQTAFAAALTTTAGAYTAGFAVGGLQTITAAARVSGTAGASGTGGVVQNVVAGIKSVQSTQIDVIFFNANPSGSTCADHSAFALVVADFAKVIGVAHLTDWTAGNPVSIGQDPNFKGVPYTLASATSIYACAVTRATPSYSTTTDVNINYVLSRN